MGKERSLSSIQKTNMESIKKDLNINYKLEKRKKICQVIELMVNARTMDFIIKFCQDKYGVSYNTAKSYYNEAQKIMNAGVEEYIDNTKGLQIRRFEYILEKCMESKDYKTCIKAMDIMNKLMKLYDDNKTEVNVNVNNLKYEFT